MESRLYGQVFHSVAEEDAQPATNISTFHNYVRPERQVTNFSVNNILPNKSRYWTTNSSRTFQVVINNDFVPTEYDRGEKQTVIINNTIPVSFPTPNNIVTQPNKKNKKRKKKKKNNKNVNSISSATRYEKFVKSCLSRPPFGNTVQNSVAPRENNLYLHELQPKNQTQPNDTEFYQNNEAVRQTVQNNKNAETIILSDSDNSVEFVPLKEIPPELISLVESDSDSSVIIGEIIDRNKSEIINLENDLETSDETKDKIETTITKNVGQNENNLHDSVLQNESASTSICPNQSNTQTLETRYNELQVQKYKLEKSITRCGGKITTLQKSLPKEESRLRYNITRKIAFFTKRLDGLNNDLKLVINEIDMGNLNEVKEDLGDIKENLSDVDSALNDVKDEHLNDLKFDENLAVQDAQDDNFDVKSEEESKQSKSVLNSSSYCDHSSFERTVLSFKASSFKFIYLSKILAFILNVL